MLRRLILSRMASIMNLRTFYVFLIIACSFLEIYGKGFGLSRGGYSSRGSSSSGSSYKPSSSRSSSGSSYKPSSSRSSSGSSYKPSSSHSSKPSSSHSSWPISSGSSGKRGSSYPIIPVPVYNNHRNRMHEGSSDSMNTNIINNDYVRVSPNHYERKIDDTETRGPPAPRYTTFRPWNIVKVNPPGSSWRRGPARRFESLPPSLRRQMERIYAVSKEMHELPSLPRIGIPRHRFQKRHACEGSQCIHEQRRKMGDDASAVNISQSLEILGNMEAKEEKPKHLASDK